MSGVVGEIVGDMAYQEGIGSFNRETSIQLGGLAGGLSAIFTGNAVGLDDAEVAANIYSGQRIGDNAARNNATYVDKKGKILRVTKENNKEGKIDKGVYIDKQDGGSSKDKLVGNTKYWDEFIIPDSGNVAIKANIHFNKSIDADIIRLSNEGGAKVGGWNSYLERAKLAIDSMPGGKFDIKSQEKYGGPFDGYLLDGSYSTMRSAGNYLAGVNSAKSGATWEDTIWAAGVLHSPIMRNRSAPYYGEIPYAGRRIESGFNSVPKN